MTMHDPLYQVDCTTIDLRESPPKVTKRRIAVTRWDILPSHFGDLGPEASPRHRFMRLLNRWNGMNATSIKAGMVYIYTEATCEPSP